MFFFMAQQPPVGQSLLIIAASPSHSDTPNSIRILWTNDQSDAENCDKKRHSQQTDIHDAGGIQTRNPSKTAEADSRLRLLGHWDRH